MLATAPAPIAGMRSTSRRNYPRVRAGNYAAESISPGITAARDAVAQGQETEEPFRDFLNRVAPRTDDEIRDATWCKPSSDQLSATVGATATASPRIAPPEMTLELRVRDTRQHALPSTVPELPQPTPGLRTLDQRHQFQQRYGEEAAPPQPFAGALPGKAEAALVAELESAVRAGTRVTWEGLAHRCMDKLFTMSLAQLTAVLRCFVLAEHDDLALFELVAAEAAHHVSECPSVELCELLHWLARAGFRDPTLLNIVGNEVALRISQDFTIAMLVELLNSYAKLDITMHRLRGLILRELQPLWADFSQNQLISCTPVMVLTLPELPLRSYLQRCADQSLGLPMCVQAASLQRQLRLLEHGLRVENKVSTLPARVQEWLSRVRDEGEACARDAASDDLSATQTDCYRILQESGCEVELSVMDGLFPLRLLERPRRVYEVLHPRDYYLVPRVQGRERDAKQLRADTKLRHRQLWRRGWKLITVPEASWLRCANDLEKKDYLEELRNAALQHKYQS